MNWLRIGWNRNVVMKCVEYPQHMRINVMSISWMLRINFTCDRSIWCVSFRIFHESISFLQKKKKWIALKCIFYPRTLKDFFLTKQKKLLFCWNIRMHVHRTRKTWMRICNMCSFGLNFRNEKKKKRKSDSAHGWREKSVICCQNIVSQIAWIITHWT